MAESEDLEVKHFFEHVLNSSVASPDINVRVQNKRTRRMIVQRDTPNILAIFCHVKPSPLNSSSTSGGMLTEGRPGPPFFTI